MIDLFTRFTISTVITSKETKVVIDKVIQCWVGTGLGTPKKILVDNGGDFAGEEFKDMCENMNLTVMHTAACSPFSNDICEQNHAVVDEMVMKMMAEEPKCKLSTALAWAVNAKNSLHMVSGFSPYQLVYGRNPSLPNVFCNDPPALENKTISKVMLEHLSAMQASRQIFTQKEFSNKISKALNNKIRSSETVFMQGDDVYYKKEGVKEWKGPGKVIGIEGKTLLIKHGPYISRVHASRARLKTKANCDKLKDLANFPVEDPIETDNPMQENDFEGFQNEEKDFEGFVSPNLMNEPNEETFICATCCRKGKYLKLNGLNPHINFLTVSPREEFHVKHSETS